MYVWVCVYVGSVMCWCVYVLVLKCVGVCMCGICNLWVCVCVGFVMCACVRICGFCNVCFCVYVCVLYCVGVCIVGL